MRTSPKKQRFPAVSHLGDIVAELGVHEFTIVAIA